MSGRARQSQTGSGCLGVFLTRRVGQCQCRKEAEDSHLFSSLPEAVDFLSALGSDRLARTFVIGGAQLYRQTMNEYPAASSSSSSQAASKAVVDRLLVTRIASPAFDECDVFFPEFRTETQKAHEEGDESQLVDGELRGQGWTRASQDVLRVRLSYTADIGLNVICDDSLGKV